MANGQYGVGASLVSLGLGQKSQAIGVLAQSANQEQQRNLQNDQLKQQDEAGKKQLGATLGAFAGTAIGGPIGGMIGGAIGGIAGGLF